VSSDAPTIEVARIGSDELALILPLIADYQRFYEVEPDDERNAHFFARFVETDDDGVLLGARRGPGSSLIGFACLHWRLDTVAAHEVVCLHDLYVVSDARGTGAGRALLEAATDAARRRRGAAALVWSTAPDNATAQRLYDATGAARSSWYEYELPVAPDGRSSDGRT
jgi:GNAT superfamily N-acetyltransferase